MSSSPDTLRFCFPTHGDSILCKINTLREQHHFCDVTLVLWDHQGSSNQPLHFHGHRAVLAASSDFLRDQFLLHEGQNELSVGVVSRAEVGKRLLLCCYTGVLEVPLKELVSYLTAASTLQMTQVVEKCTQAISQFLSPTLAFLKAEVSSEEKEIQKAGWKWPGNSFKNQEERDAAQPSTSILEASTRKGGVAVIQSTPRFSQWARLQGHDLGEADAAEITEDTVCCIDTLESEEGGDFQLALRCKLHPTAAGGGPAQHELAGSSQNQDEGVEETQREEEEIALLTAQLMDPDLLCLASSHCSGDEPTEGSEAVLIQRPYLCRRCDRVFQHLESYMGHLKEHRQYLCLVCGKGFSRKSNLTRHLHVHTGVKLFRCPLCQKTFSQKAKLQDHVKLHTEDEPHKCQFCSVWFTNKPDLRRHLKDIHGKSSLQNMLEEAVH